MRTSNLSFIRVIVFILFPSISYSQTPSSQEYLNASAVLAQNYELLLELDSNNIDHMAAAQVLIADMELLANIVEIYERSRVSKITNSIDAIENQANLITRSFSSLDVAAMDDQLVSVLSKIDDLSQQRELARQNLQNISQLRSRISAANNVLNKVGNTLSVIDTGINAWEYISAVQSDADTFEILQAEGDFVVSAAVTGIVFLAPNYLPPVAIASASVATTSWYIDKVGDAVRTGTVARSSIYYNTINNAGLTIQNTILRNYKAGTPLSRNQIQNLVNTTYEQVIAEIESFRSDIGMMERFFGLKGIEEEAIDRAIFLVNTILDGRGVDRAIQFDLEIKEKIYTVERLNEVISEIAQSVENIQPNEMTQLRKDSENIIASRIDQRRSEIFRSATNNADSTIEANTDIVFTPILIQGDINPNLDRSNEIVTEIINENRPEEPTGPTPEEIAEAELQAELERQRIEAERLARIDALEDERTSQFLVKLDAEARIRNNNNRLAILEFDERERVQSVLTVVNTEAARLRGELNSTGLNDADAKRLQDIMRYGEVLEGELDRIATEEASLRTRNTEYQAALDAANATIVRNSNQLNALNYDWNQFTVPTISVVLPDWSNYEYELPPFNETEVPTNDIVNVVVSTVSLAAPYVNIGYISSAVSEDGRIINFDRWGVGNWGVDNAAIERLEGFEHLYIGNNSDGLRWIYGEASTPEQFVLRTGTATFRGGLLGNYVPARSDGSLEINTVFQDSVFGNLTLNIDFSSNQITGEGSLEIDNEVRRENLSFALNEAAITQNNDGLTRSLRFGSGAGLLDGVTGTGYFAGTFYGADASEAAGLFNFGLVGGFAFGVWATGENFAPRDESGFSGAYVIGYTGREDGYGTAWDEGEKTSATRLNYFNGDGDGSVDIVSTLPAGSFSFVSWGSWIANSTTRDALGNAGYWLHADPVTSPAIVENRTGTAQYGGEIIGGYVGSGFHTNAQGIISLTANFADQSIGGQFQFGRDCSGSGLSRCSVASEVQSFNEPINDYDGAGFGNFERTGNSGVVGVFAGDNAQEIGGHAWLTENQGMYIGVFRAGEGLSFGEFVTPTGTSTSTDYSNYRGLLAYRGFEAEPALFAEIGEPVSGFVGVESVSSAAEVSFNNSNLTRSAAHSSSDTSGTYSYVTWGEWDSRSAGSVFTIDGQSVDQGRGNWLVYDPTTDLPTSGSASYQGTVDGSGSGVAGGVVSGGINLEADFGNDRITGSMSLRDGNNTSWADAAFDAPITRDTDSSGFQGALTGTNVGSGAIFGGFAGPNAEEVGGGWQINHVNGSDANGIFRAQQ